MAKPEIQSTTFANGQSMTQRDNVHALYSFYTFIKAEYQQKSDIINDLTDYVLSSILFNELFMKIILLLLWLYII